jgi:hypothetical protein
MAPDSVVMKCPINDSVVMKCPINVVDRLFELVMIERERERERERILISLSSQHLFSAITEQCSCTDVKKLKLSSRLFWPKFDNLAC